MDLEVSTMAQEMDPRAMQLMQMLGAGGPGGLPPGMGAPPPPQGMPGGMADDELSQDEEELVKSALDSIGSALGLPTVSERERMILEQATSILQKLLANREGEVEKAMGGGGAMAVLRRQGMRGQ